MKRIVVMFGVLMIALAGSAAMEKAPMSKDELREKYRKEAEHAREITEQEKKRAIGEYEFHRNFKNTVVLTPEPFVQAFPVLFEHVPASSHQKIVDYAVFMYGEQAFSKLKDALAQKKIVPDHFKWKALGFAHNVVPYISRTNKYFYFEQNDKHDTSLKGVRNDKVLREYLEFDTEISALSQEREYLIKAYDKLREEYKILCVNTKQEGSKICKDLNFQIVKARNDLLSVTTELEKSKQKQKNIGRSLVEEYKIHLMPEGDLTPVILRLLEALQNDELLQHSIAAFKVLTGREYVFDGQAYARVVIYPTAGKGNAQLALQKIYELFKGIDGLDERPRFNAKVTDLIWIAQGDSMYKRGNFLKYYEAPNYVYYNPEFMGTKQNYHLLHPQTKQEIVY